jgi:hypothetical protein
VSQLHLGHNLLDGLGPLGFIWLQIYLFSIYRYVKVWARGSVVVKPLGYKPEGRGFETR